MAGVRGVRFVSMVILVKGVLNALLGVSPPLQLLVTGIIGLAALAFSKGEFRGGIS